MRVKDRTPGRSSTAAPGTSPADVGVGTQWTRAPVGTAAQGVRTAPSVRWLDGRRVTYTNTDVPEPQTGMTFCYNRAVKRENRNATRQPRARCFLIPPARGACDRPLGEVQPGVGGGAEDLPLRGEMNGLEPQVETPCRDWIQRHQMPAQTRLTW